MQTPVRITYRDTDASAALEARIRKHIADLEHCCDCIVDCHVTVESPAGRRRNRIPLAVNVDLTIPGRQIAVHSSRANAVAHADIDAALQDTFATLRRLLQDYLPFLAEGADTHVT